MHKSASALDDIRDVIISKRSIARNDTEIYNPLLVLSFRFCYLSSIESVMIRARLKGCASFSRNVRSVQDRWRGCTPTPKVRAFACLANHPDASHCNYTVKGSFKCDKSAATHCTARGFARGNVLCAWTNRNDSDRDYFRAGFIFRFKTRGK